MSEKTLIIIKHDGILKGLIGEITKRFEGMGMSVVGMKMVWADKHLAENHYHVTDEWAKTVFDKAKKTYASAGKKFEFTDHKQYGRMIKEWNETYLQEGPIVAMVLAGPHAIELGRKLVGNTEPRQALPGTIRGDYSFESYELSDAKKRPVRNLVHASGSTDEAEREIALWFKKDEIHEYKK